MPAKVHAKIKKSPDFELHVRTVREEGLSVLELRDYVPSEKWYGRGVQIEPHQLPDLISALKGIASYNGGSSDRSQSNAARAAMDADPTSLKLF